MTVIDRPWLFRDDDGRPRVRTSWHEESRSDGSERWHGPVERKVFEPYDRQTLALVQRLEELRRFRHGEAVGPLLEEWRWRDSMHGPAEKQRFLEPLIQRAKRDPDANEGVLIFLLLVCEGVRRGVVRELLAARTGLEGPSAAPAFHRREEARRIRDIERERLFDVTRTASLEALYATRHRRRRTSLDGCGRRSLTERWTSSAASSRSYAPVRSSVRTLRRCRHSYLASRQRSHRRWPMTGGSRAGGGGSVSGRFTRPHHRGPMKVKGLRSVFWR